MRYSSYEFLDYNYSIVSTATIKKIQYFDKILISHWIILLKHSIVFCIFSSSSISENIFISYTNFTFSWITKIYFDTLEIHNKTVYENSCKFLTSC